MKKVFILVFAAAFLFIGCGDEDPKPASSDDNEEVAEPDDENEADEDIEIVNDGDVVADEEILSDEDTGSTEEPDETEEPTEPQIDPIGNFSLDFSGQVNTTISTSSRGGTGVANFNYNGMPFTFNQINIPVVGDIFPLAMVNSGNIIVLWLDSLGLSDISGTSEKQVFGISFPQGAEIGSGTMKDLGSYAFYGDITVNITGGQFNIKCVRAVSDSGEYTINSNDGANIAFLANGDLFDPSLAGSMIPYPACE